MVVQKLMVTTYVIHRSFEMCDAEFDRQRTTFVLANLGVAADLWSRTSNRVFIYSDRFNSNMPILPSNQMFVNIDEE
jgi:hypothetical protein